MFRFVLGLVIGVAITCAFYQMIHKKLRKQIQSSLMKEKQMYSLVENTKDALYYFELIPEWKYKYIYPPLEDTYGKDLAEKIYKDPQILLNLIHPEDYDMQIKKIKGEVDYSKPLIFRIADRSGEYHSFEEFTTPVYEDGKLIGIQGILRNIDEKLRMEQEVEYRLNHDNATGSYNRNYYDDIVHTYNTKVDTPIGMIIFDLDNLKYVNDTYGHRKGDQLIKITAGLLNIFSNDHITISRIGGDEFVILTTQGTELDVKQLMNNVVAAIEEYNDNSADMKIRMSVGYSYSPYSIGQMDRVFEEADRNMYDDKFRKKLMYEI
ncbi:MULTISPECIES: sensor domain-containing diguanylate cyclase [Bacillus]|uniref:sensor domain-containing diguanylate cyclase n=1 Tax=Bacillus TaxID=1386 RepID=UPI00030069CA|nr:MULTISPECIES: sensor domain-containing diguanylate cyclase [Bacillus]